MNDKIEPIFHTIPDEEFVNRGREIEYIYQLALESSDNITQSLFLYGKRKVGKTEVLKRVYHRLFWKQDRIIPFYYTFHREFPDSLEFAKDYLREFVKQYLGFIRRDPAIVRSNISLSKILNLVEEEEYPGLKGLIENFQEQIGSGDYLEALRISVFAPYTVSVKGFTRAFVILDDFHRTKDVPFHEEKGSLLREFSEILKNRICPHIITGYSIKMLKEIFGAETFIGTSDIMELKRLTVYDAIDLFENLCKLYHLKFEEECTHQMVNRLDHNPFYIKSFIRSARQLRVDLQTFRDFQKLYVREVTAGNIGFYLSSILNAFVGDEKKRGAVKILNACIEAPKEGLTRGFLAEKVSLNPNETFNVLMALQEGGLVEVDYGRVKGISETVLRDFVTFNFSTVIRGQDPLFVKAEMERDGLKALYRQCSIKLSEDIKRQSRKVLEFFNCQKVPEILFDYRGFSLRFGSTDFFNVSEYLRKDEVLLHLPQIIGVSTLSSPNSNVPDMGYGFEEGKYEHEKEVLWISGIFTRSKLVKEDDVREFLREANKIKEKMGDVKAILWIVGKEGFTDKAVDLVAVNGIKSASLAQLYHLRDLLFEDELESLEEVEPLEAWKERDTIQQNGPDTQERKGNEFELVIPMASDTELVAARAIEEIAKRANFDHDSIGQIKMALIEACINASEHSDVIDGRITLRFIVDHDRLTMYVQNEGSGFDPSLVAEPNIGEKVFSSSKRGWGIKLMKSFMDEVEFESVANGTRVKMVKLLKSFEMGKDA